jgi:hypothetical protein
MVYFWMILAINVSWYNIVLLITIVVHIVTSAVDALYPTNRR